MKILTATYYSLIIGSTPEISVAVQLTFIVRYVLSDGSPVERFLIFIPSTGHKSQQLANVTSTLTGLDINILNCQGQSYENSSNISDIYNGLQVKIKEISHLAEYVSCTAHWLDLVGECAAESSQEARSCFLYCKSFIVSYQRWEVLQAHLTVKSLSATRWSACAEAC